MRASQLQTAVRGTQEAVSPPRSGGEPALVLGRYRLHDRLGAGGFGTVWMARDERLERDVAVKILPRERVVGGRFEREARAAARLAHPGIVTLYEAAVDDEGAYLVSELVRGATLEQLLEAGRLSDRDIVAIGMALCEALAHAHSNAVVHRDVKPSNVLVPSRTGRAAQVAKLTDFGVARVIGGDALTQTGEVIGTAAYMAPEQAEGRPAGAPADVYSLALVIYESLTGVNPVRTGTAAQRARRLGAHLPPLRRQRRDLPRELGHAIDLALRPRPRERGSVEELHESLAIALEQVQDQPGIVAEAWPRRTGRDEHRSDSNPALGRRLEVLTDQAYDDDPLRARWVARSLAGIITAGLTAWLAAHLLTPAPLAPAAVPLIAGLMIAALPRLGWIALTAALGVALALAGRPGGALVLVLAALLPVAALPRTGLAWGLSAAAPALGWLGLAGAWPALAARASTAWRRACLGMIGWAWLAIAAPLVNADLYASRPRSTPAPQVWMPSLTETAHHVLGPLLTSGTLAPAAVWGLAAVVLGWIRSGRSLALKAVLVAVWAATVVSATSGMLDLSTGHHLLTPRAAVLGAVASAAVALLPPVTRRRGRGWALTNDGQDLRSMESPRAGSGIR